MFNSELQTVITAVRQSLRGQAKVVVLATALSLAQSVVAIVGLMAFVPALTIMAGQDFTTSMPFPVLVEYLNDFFPDSKSRFYALLAILFVATIAKATLMYLSQILEVYVQTSINGYWQRRILFNWFGASFVSHSQDHVARVIHLCTREALTLAQAGRAVIVTLSALVQVIIYAIFLMTLSPAIVLASIAIMVGAAALLSYVIHRAFVTSAADALSNLNLTERIVSSIKRIDLIDIYGTDKQEKGILEKYIVDYLRNFVNYQRVRVIAPSLLQILFFIIIAGILSAIFEFSTGPIPVGELLIFIGAMVIIQPQLERINQSVVIMIRIGAAYSQIRPVIDLEPRAAFSGEPAKAIDTDKNAFQITNLTFAHERDGELAPILERVNLTLKSGRLYMLFGPTGVGKSTFLRLLQRLLIQQSGIIRFGGVDIRDLSQEDLSRLVTYMPQENLVFTGTVRQNLEYGLDNVSDSELERSLVQACAHDFVSSMGNGLDSEVGADGSRLSAGQRQRIGLARVIVKSPSVMLLDEPTSALDRETEHAVIKSLLGLRDNGQTIIMSTHKVELAPFADRVLWFDGRKIANGRFEDFQHSLSKLIPHDAMRRVLVASR